MKEIVSKHSLGNTDVYYISEQQHLGMVILPKGIEPVLADGDMRPVASLVQVKLLGDAYPGAFGNGVTMIDSETSENLRYVDSEVTENDDNITVITNLRNDDISAKHELIWKKGYDVLESRVTVANISDEKVSLEMLGSFCLGMLSPLDQVYKPNKLRIHRLRGRWSQENRLDSFWAEDALLSPTTAGATDAYSEKFGQTGNKTTGVYTPFLAVEDTEYGIIWGTQLLIDGSWQLEIYNKHETLNIAGGLADYDLGHWMKDLEPGASFTSPSAFLAVCKGDIDDLCDQLTDIQNSAVPNYPENEQDLPVMFNEWCSSWGCPSRENVFKQIELLKGRGLRYYVMDAGWYKDAANEWFELTGDWIPSKEKYPNGIKEVTDAIRDAGMVPGIWCEVETCGVLSEAYQMKEHLLTKHGKQIKAAGRKYLDFRDPWTIDYLNTRLVDLLESAGFGYLKIDSNECCGIGCDGEESLGEGLRHNLECFDQFVKNMQKRLPKLVVENCSSGGMRVTPKQSLMYPIFSGSDSFECASGPIIFANNQRMALPRQNQVWCTLRAEEDEQKLMYKLSAGFLGRMCLSGSLAELSERQLSIMDEAIALYKKSVEVLKNGKTRHIGPHIRSYTKPNGWQAVVREGKGIDETLVVFRSFEMEVPETIYVDIPDGNFVIEWTFKPDFVNCDIENGKLKISGMRENTGCVFMLKK